MRLSGRLTSATMGALKAKALVIYRRQAGGAWRVMRNVTTATNGSYHATVELPGTASFKVAWLGVVQSAALSVKRG